MALWVASNCAAGRMQLVEQLMSLIKIHSVRFQNPSCLPAFAYLSESWLNARTAAENDLGGQRKSSQVKFAPIDFISFHVYMSPDLSLVSPFGLCEQFGKCLKNADWVEDEAVFGSAKIPLCETVIPRT